MTQPLDVGINRSFKARCRRRWEEWIINLLDTTDKVRDAMREEVSEWVAEVFWEFVDSGSRILRNAWRKTGYDWFPGVDDQRNKNADDDSNDDYEDDVDDDRFDDSLFYTEEVEEESGDIDGSEDEG